MRASDRRIMLFKIQDLMVTVLPSLDLKLEDGSTVGSCTSEHDRNCHLSLDILDLTPYAHIDPAYLPQLRVLLDHALARSRVVVPNGQDLAVLEERMAPHRVEDIIVLEEHLTKALAEVRAKREQTDEFLKANPGWQNPSLKAD